MRIIFFTKIIELLQNKNFFTFRKFINYIIGKKTERSFVNPEHFNGNDGETVSGDSKMHNIYKNHDGYVCNKWEQYLEIYERCFSHYSLPVSVLEIGIQNGGFLEILEKYLPKGSKITGVDIDKKCASLEFSEAITFIEGNATDKNFIDKNFGNSKFDVIIDDASHICEDVIATFNLMFDKLNYGGLYIIEDCHTSYWDDKFNGGFRRKNSIMEYFKNLTDAMNFYYINPNETSKKTISHLGKMKSDIACISFYDSVIIIEKYVKPKNQPFRNYFSGQKDLVVQKQDMINASCLKCDKNTKFEKFLK